MFGGREWRASIKRCPRIEGRARPAGKGPGLGHPAVDVEKHGHNGADPERAAEKVDQGLFRHLSLVAPGHYDGARRGRLRRRPGSQFGFEGVVGTGSGYRELAGLAQCGAFRMRS